MYLTPTDPEHYCSWYTTVQQYTVYVKKTIGPTEGQFMPWLGLALISAAGKYHQPHHGGARAAAGGLLAYTRVVGTPCVNPLYKQQLVFSYMTCIRQARY